MSTTTEIRRLASEMSIASVNMTIVQRAHYYAGLASNNRNSTSFTEFAMTAAFEGARNEALHDAGVTVRTRCRAYEDWLDECKDNGTDAANDPQERRLALVFACSDLRDLADSEILRINGVIERVYSDLVHQCDVIDGVDEL